MNTKIAPGSVVPADEFIQKFTAPNDSNKSVQILRPFFITSADNFGILFNAPLGIALLAGTLEAAGYKVDIIDAQAEGINRFTKSECGRYVLHGLNIEEILSRIKPDTTVLGISVMYSMGWLFVRDLIEAIKQRYPKIVIVGGGEHISAMAEYVLSDSAFDYLIRGEGEIPFLNFVHNIFTAQPVDEVWGLMRRKQDTDDQSNTPPQRMRNVDHIPPPAWHLLDIERYFDHDITPTGSPGAKRRLPLLANRGCPYRCTFCSSPAMWTTRYVSRDPASVVEEIDDISTRYQLDMIMIFDLTFSVNRSWLLTFCDEIKKREIKVKWEMPSGTRSEVLDLEVLSAMKSVGCAHITFNPESGSQNTLKRMKKHVNLEAITKSLRIAVGLGYDTKAAFIIGYPGETFGDVLKTLAFALRLAALGASDAFFGIFIPYPGSEIFYKLLDEGKIQKIDDDYFHNLRILADPTSSVSFCENLSGRTLNIFRFFCFVSFYIVSYFSHPRKLLRVFKGFFQKSYVPQNFFESRIITLLMNRRTGFTKQGLPSGDNS